jgi:hypothetical protein
MNPAYLCCPGCGHRKVTLQLGQGDCYVCRSCHWSAWAAGEGDTAFDRARREALRRANPSNLNAPAQEAAP